MSNFELISVPSKAQTVATFDSREEFKATCAANGIEVTEGRRLPVAKLARALKVDKVVCTEAAPGAAQLKAPSFRVWSNVEYRVTSAKGNKGKLRKIDGLRIETDKVREVNNLEVRKGRISTEAHHRSIVHVIADMEKVSPDRITVEDTYVDTHTTERGTSRKRKLANGDTAPQYGVSTEYVSDEDDESFDDIDGPSDEDLAELDLA